MRAARLLHRRRRRRRTRSRSWRPTAFGLEGEPATFTSGRSRARRRRPRRRRRSPPARRPRPPRPDATFAFAGTDNMTGAAELGFECSLDGGPFAACTSPHELADVAEGDHTLARARGGRRRQRRPDPGRAGLAGARHHAARDGDRQPGRTTRPAATGATFTFSSDEAGVDVRVLARRRRLRGRARRRTWSSGLALGDHRFARAGDRRGRQRRPDAGRARVDGRGAAGHDGAGHRRSPPARRPRRPRPPRRSRSRPTRRSTGSSARWTAAPSRRCDSPHVVEGLALGDAHARRPRDRPRGQRRTRRRRATRGRSSTARRRRPRSARAPRRPSTTSTTAAFSFTADEAGSTFECQLDTGAWARVHVAEGLHEPEHGSAHVPRAGHRRGGQHRLRRRPRHTWTIAPHVHRLDRHGRGGRRQLAAAELRRPELRRRLQRSRSPPRAAATPAPWCASRSRPSRPAAR